MGTRLRPAGRFVSRNVAGETILVPVRGDVAQLDSIFTLNATAAVLWEGVEKSLDEPALAALLEERFVVSPEQARADVRAFLETLRTEALVEADPAP